VRVAKSPAIVDQFNNSKRATSRRHNHPHPAFNADGMLHSKVTVEKWTQLMVAERE
jgi:hypothetical protein